MAFPTQACLPMAAAMKVLSMSVRSLTKKNVCVLAVALVVLATVGDACAQDSKLNVSGSITSTTCTLDTPNLDVDMGRVGVKDILAVGVGSRIPAFQSVTIDLTCQAGANVSMTLQDAGNPASTSPYIALDTAGGVAGIGIQLLRAGDGSEVPLGPSASWVVARNVSAGKLSIPLQAHYYRSATTVSAGNVNAGALFTVAYD